MSRSTHHCYATGCPTRIALSLLMCPRHWRMVPKAIQKRVWATYQEGQELPNGPAPTTEYWLAVAAARDAVAEIEHRQASLFDQL